MTKRLALLITLTIAIVLAAVTPASAQFRALTDAELKELNCDQLVEAGVDIVDQWDALGKEYNSTEDARKRHEMRQQRNPLRNGYLELRQEYSRNGRCGSAADFDDKVRGRTGREKDDPIFPTW